MEGESAFEDCFSGSADVDTLIRHVQFIIMKFLSRIPGDLLLVSSICLKIRLSVTDLACKSDTDPLNGLYSPFFGSSYLLSNR